MSPEAVGIASTNDTGDGVAAGAQNPSRQQPCEDLGSRLGKYGKIVIDEGVPSRYQGSINAELH